jgi:hypothetical protein
MSWRGGVSGVPFFGDASLLQPFPLTSTFTFTRRGRCFFVNVNVDGGVGTREIERVRLRVAPARFA